MLPATTLPAGVVRVNFPQEGDLESHGLGSTIRCRNPKSLYMSFLHFGKSTLGQLPHVVGAVVSDDKNAGSDHDQTMLPKTGLVIVGDDDVDDVVAWPAATLSINVLSAIEPSEILDTALHEPYTPI